MKHQYPDEAEVRRRLDRQAEIAASLSDDLPIIGRFVMAGDMEQSERLLVLFRAGEITAEETVRYQGSYTRWNVATTLWEEGHLSDDWFFSRVADLWSGSDPDDTNPKFWDIWQQAMTRNGGRVLDEDGVDLPGSPSALVRLFRGQVKGATLGCSWTTDITVARAFAQHGGMRGPIKNGVLYRVGVPKTMILAYLTGRDESEVIIDPREMAWVTPEEE